MERKVTERDLRRPEFRDDDVNAFEFRDDGEIARKDGWERGMREIVGIIGWSRESFEMGDVIERVRELIPICGGGVVGCTGGPQCTIHE